MPGPHRKMVTQEESATVSEGEGEGVARETGRAEKGERGDGGVRGAPCQHPFDLFTWLKEDEEHKD